MSTLSPIVLFTYNRPWHTQQTVEALKKNDLASESDLFIYADGSKEHSDTQVEQLRKYLKTITGFKSVTLVERKKNYGLAENIVDGVTEIVNQYGKVIVLEDDIVTSPSFLQYMNANLDAYENEENVISIHAYNYPVRAKLPKIFFIKGADCWGWATWKRGWDLYEQDAVKLYNDLQYANLLDEFDFWGAYPYSSMLEKQAFGGTSWAVRWYASAFLNDKLTLYPGKSLIKNVGFDSAATHTKSTNDSWFNPKSIPATYETEKIPVIEDFEAKKVMAHYLKSLTQKPKYVKRIKKKMRLFTPPIFHVLKDRFKPKSKLKSNLAWQGNYATWQEAQARCEGYAQEAILEKVREAVLKVKHGQAAYERDSVIFDRIQYSWPLLATLLHVGTQNQNTLHVLDFGGSLGSTYFQNRQMLAGLREIKWSVVEQPHFVEAGTKEIADESLRFFSDFEQAYAETQPQVLLLSSVLQYLEKPYQQIDFFLQFQFDYIIIDRTAFINTPNDRLTIQRVPEKIYKASYPAWFFNKGKLIFRFLERYELVDEFDNGFTSPMQLEDGKRVYWAGLIFRQK